MFVVLEIRVHFENCTLDFLEIFMESQLLLIEYFVLWAGFSSELSEDAEQNSVNQLIIDIQKLLHVILSVCLCPL